MGLNPGFPCRINPPVFILWRHFAAAWWRSAAASTWIWEPFLSKRPRRGTDRRSAFCVWRGRLHGSAPRRQVGGDLNQYDPPSRGRVGSDRLGKQAWKRATRKAARCFQTMGLFRDNLCVRNGNLVAISEHKISGFGLALESFGLDRRAGGRRGSCDDRDVRRIRHRNDAKRHIK